MWLGDLPVAVMKPKTGGFDIFYVWTDNLGTPRQITDITNQSRWEWPNADPFGNNLPNENPAGLGAFNYNLRFPGQYYDVEKGSNYNYFCDYDPAIGRYVQGNPVGLYASFNSFAYVDSDPPSYIDPNGLWRFGDPLPQGLVDGVAGFGDVLSFGVTVGVREAIGANRAVNFCAPECFIGAAFGVVVHIVGFRTGGELSIGNNFRLAPWGNRTGNALGRWPHYHRRGTSPGQGIGRHRPWETKSNDTGFGDRF